MEIYEFGYCTYSFKLCVIKKISVSALNTSNYYTGRRQKFTHVKTGLVCKLFYKNLYKMFLQEYSIVFKCLIKVIIGVNEYIVHKGILQRAVNLLKKLEFRERICYIYVIARNDPEGNKA